MIPRQWRQTGTVAHIVVASSLQEGTEHIVLNGSTPPLYPVFLVALSLLLPF